MTNLEMNPIFIKMLVQNAVFIGFAAAKVGLTQESLLESALLNGGSVDTKPPGIKKAAGVDRTASLETNF